MKTKPAILLLVSLLLLATATPVLAYDHDEPHIVFQWSRGGIGITIWSNWQIQFYVTRNGETNVYTWSCGGGWHVVPEVPFGTLMTILAMLAATLAVYYRRGPRVQIPTKAS